MSAWAALLAAALATQALPKPAHGVFVSHTYAITFRAPPGLTYCPLDDHWTGSDHGTVLFLTPPSVCNGAGYPSSARGFEPEDVPRSEIYYGNRPEEYAPTPPCHAVGRMRFLGRLRPLCRTAEAGAVIVRVGARYTADSFAEAYATLVTTPGRLGHDLGVLRSLGQSAHTCAAPWQDARGRTRYTGSGRPCPASGGFY